MGTTKTKTQISEVKIFINFHCELYASYFGNAAEVGNAVTRAIARFTQEINMPLEYCKMHIQQEDCGTFKVTIEAKTEGKKAFSDYKQEYSWSDMVSKTGDRIFTKWKLKSYLLFHSSSGYSGSFKNYLSFTLHKTVGSDISGHTIYL